MNLLPWTVTLLWFRSLRVYHITSRTLDFRTKATFNVTFFKLLWGIRVALGVKSFVSNGGGILLKKRRIMSFSWLSSLLNLMSFIHLCQNPI